MGDKGNKNTAKGGDSRPVLQIGRDVITAEAQGLKALAQELGESFAHAVNLLKSCQGRVIFSGMGKSGHIAAKLAATMASTGTPAFAIHPGEASHGDLGMVASTDVLVLLSNSGNSTELHDMIAYGVHENLPIIGISKNPESRVGKAATIFLPLPDVDEACALHLAPTTSTTMTLALGDALCVALMQEKGFRPQDFHRFHPGGKLGLNLMSVRDLMRPARQVPQCDTSSPMALILEHMNKGGLGLVAIMDQSTLIGLITDGDIRRNSHLPLIEQSAQSIMSTHPIYIHENALAKTALALMNAKGVTALIVRNEDHDFVGLLHIHELLRAGLA